MCLPTVVEEFLRQAKAAQLFMSSSETFVFNDLLESDDLSRSFGGMDRLDMFFPFDPCLLKKSERFVTFGFCIKQIDIQLNIFLVNFSFLILLCSPL